jgi:glycerate dehydrogenase
MNSTVFLNAARLDFDRGLDFSPLSGLTRFTSYADSTDDEIPARVEGHSIVITKELALGKELIHCFPASVRLICEAGTGYNNIDIAAARSRGIGVCNVPSYSTDAVAQLAITFMLNLSASLVQQQTMLRRGDLDNFQKSLQLPHVELNGKTLGVVGFGEIGRRVIAIARLLGMKIIVHSRTPRPEVDPDVRFVSLDELLRQSDFVSLHCPLNDATRHVINAERLALMKPNAFIINTSRGPLIDEPALIEALTRGTIAGAGLDVQEQEPPEPDNPLYSLENVILTPHIGWKRLETRQRLIGLTAANIDAFIKGAPINIVN